MNTGDSPLVLFCVYPGEAGHDYSTIRKQGFGRMVVRRDGRPAVVPNRRRRESEVRGRS